MAYGTRNYNMQEVSKFKDPELNSITRRRLADTTKIFSKRTRTDRNMNKPISHWMTPNKPTHYEERKELIKKWMEAIGINLPYYVINKNLTVQVLGKNVNLSGIKIPGGKIPFQFSNVQKDFICSNCGLKSLHGVPLRIGGNFDCSHNNLKSLHQGPQKVKGHYNCSHNQIKNLEGGFIGPNTKVYGDFNCSNNSLFLLNGGPDTIEGDFDIRNNPLKNISQPPQWVKGEVLMNGNIPKIDKNLFFGNSRESNFGKKIGMYITKSELNHQEKNQKCLSDIEKKMEAKK